MQQSPTPNITQAQKDRTMPIHGEFSSDAEELEARRRFMSGEGYRFCDIPACNCISWHGGNASHRLSELRYLLDDYAVPTNGIVMRDVIEKLAKDAGYTND